MNSMRLGVVLLLAACVPDFDVRSSIIDEPTVLAVIAEPAEARPGTRVDYRAVAVAPGGRESAPTLRWSHCSTPKAGVDSGALNDACFDALPFASARSSQVSAALPMDGCARFGPDPPPGDARPRDADATGGYYQPVVLQGYGAPAVHLQRLLCNPRNSPADVARDFAASYVPNRNPDAPELELRDARSGVEPGQWTVNTTLELELRWRAEDAEDFVWIDPASSTLRPRRESLLISWFASAGAFDSDRSVVAEGALVSRQTNRWTAPPEPGRVRFWVVLRDSRGGAAFAEREIELERLDLPDGSATAKARPTTRGHP